jgi:hypothetical protein
MPMISVDYEYNLPNDFLVDHSQSMGKKRQTTYDGPDKIYLIIDNETGREHMGPITAEEKADGRPVPLGCRYVEVDCAENPLLCQLRGPVIDEAEEDHTGSQPHPLSPEIEGYHRYTYQTPILPRNIYDNYAITVDENDNITIPIRTVVEAMYGNALTEFPDWTFVRKQRDKMLAAADGRISDDMPESLKQEWYTYRQLLRDMPAVMEENNVPAHIALLMMPEDPDSKLPPGRYEV